MDIHVPFTKKSKKQLSEPITLPINIQAISESMLAFGNSYNQGGFAPMGIATNTRYDGYREFMRKDPEMRNTVDKMALLAQYGYKGVTINNDEEDVSDDEIKMLRKANRVADELDFRTLFYTLAKKAIRDGDVAFVTAFAPKVGIQQIQMLPSNQLTILDDLNQLEKAHIPAQHGNYYVLNELFPMRRQIFWNGEPGRKVYKVGLDNLAEGIYDNITRYTFGIWSESPLESLKTRVLWKQAILLTDVLWRYRNVPRERHKLDTSMFVPENFSGATRDAQIANAMTAAQAYVKQYADDISNKTPDQGYIYGSNVLEMGYMESKSMNYAEPNGVIDQINASIREGLGGYNVGQGTYATELVTASYVVLLPDFVGYKIKRVLRDVLRNHMILAYNYSLEDVLKLDIKVNLILDILQGELARQIAVLAAAGVETTDELRGRLGDSPATKKQKEELKELKKNVGQVQSQDDLRNNAERGSGQPPQTGETRAAKQNT